MQSSGTSYSRGDDEELPSLSAMRVSAPKNGSEARSFEIEHVDEAVEVAQVLIGDEAFPEVEEPDVPKVKGPPEDAGFGALAMYYFERLSALIFGEREEKVEMNCKAKRDGGKVCSVTRS